MTLAANIVINTLLPGTSPTNTVAGEIMNFYSFALLISGILAFGAVTWGGIKYATGRGNPTAESEGRSWITNALLGLLLLAGAWIILFTINPQLVSLPQNIALPALNAAPTGSWLPGIGDTAGGTITTLPNGQICQQDSSGIACLPSGTSIQTLPNGQVCKQNSAGLSCLPAGTPIILPNGQLCSKTSAGMSCAPSNP